MKINLNTMLLLVGLPLIVYVSSAFAHTDVTAEEARELIDYTDDLIVVDVREPHEYNGTGGHIPGALNYPLNSGVLQARYKELPVDGPILVVCRSGGRSNRAATFLDSQGFSMVYDMLRGMSAWKWETETDVDPDSKYGGGTGEPNDPYQIATVEDLMLLSESLEDYDKHFILTADIDLDPNLPGRKIFDRAVIGTFTGIFDGNGHVISNLWIKGFNHLGLFGQLASGARISNLGLESADVDGTGWCVGGLVGENYGSIATSYSTGNVRGDENLGGLVGVNNGGNITMSYSTGTVVGDDAAVGGLVGQNVSGSILGCYSIGDVGGYEWIGGLVGWNNSEGSISDCYSAGDVSGSWEIGGLVGENSGIITMSYSTSVVSGHTRVGGLVGSNSCVQNARGKITDSYWDIETSGELNMCGLQEEGSSGCDPNCGKITIEMQTAGTFLEAGWDFVGEIENGTEDIWSICEGTNYPRFVWQIPVGDFICPDGITMDDFFFLLEFWLNDNCDSSNDYCQGTDLDQSGKVDEDDLEIFFESWLAE